MKILIDIELQKLTTKRLLALYKKVRAVVRKRDGIGIHAEYNAETIDLIFYKMDIKNILDNREDVCL